MRYVIVCVLKGEAGDFNNNLRKDILKKFNAKSSKLPAHFTIKAPFEYDGSIIDLENNIEAFCKRERSQPFRLNNYNHFDNRVIYMDVDMSKEGKMLHDRLIEEIDKSSYINFTKTDGKDKVFHVTLSSKKLPPIYEEVWNYVNQYKFDFKCNFDNITIYKWEENTWKIYREFLLLL